MNDKREMSLLPFLPLRLLVWLSLRSLSACIALETLIYWPQYECEEQMFDDVASYEAHGLLHFSTKSLLLKQTLYTRHLSFCKVEIMNCCIPEMCQTALISKQ